MKIATKNGDLMVSILLKTRRYNPYNDIAGDNPDTGEMDNIVGVIEDHKGWEEMGFMYLEDMDYKGKDDQLTDWCVKYHGEPEKFEKLCRELKIPLWKI